MDRDEIKARLKARKIKQVDLANRLGIDPDKVSKSLDAKGTRSFSEDEMRIIRQMLREESDPVVPADFPLLPVIGQVQAGGWSEAVQRPGGLMPSPTALPPKRAFGLIVSGTSMDKLVDDGATVIVDPDDKALFPGKFYVVLNSSGETTFKRFEANPARLEPCSTDPRHQPIMLGGEDTFTIVGRVIWRAAPM